MLTNNNYNNPSTPTQTKKLYSYQEAKAKDALDKRIPTSHASNIWIDVNTGAVVIFNS